MRDARGITGKGYWITDGLHHVFLCWAIYTWRHWSHTHTVQTLLNCFCIYTTPATEFRVLIYAIIQSVSQPCGSSAMRKKHDACQELPFKLHIIHQCGKKSSSVTKRLANERTTRPVQTGRKATVTQILFFTRFFNVVSRKASLRRMVFYSSRRLRRFPLLIENLKIQLDIWRLEKHRHAIGWLHDCMNTQVSLIKWMENVYNNLPTLEQQMDLVVNLL